MLAIFLLAASMGGLAVPPPRATTVLVRTRPGATLQPRHVATALGHGHFILRERPQRERAALRALSERAARTCNCEVPDLSRWIHVVADHSVSEESLRALRALPDVEHVAVRPPLAPPPDDLAPPTGLFTSRHAHMDAAPVGMGIRAVRSLAGGNGESITVVDVEAAWTTDHEDLDACSNGLLSSIGSPRADLPYATYAAHGTATAGALMATDNAFGVEGVVPLASCVLAPSTTAEHGDDVARALLQPAMDGILRAGDVVLLQQQVGGPRWNGVTEAGLLPAEWDAEIFDAVQTLVALGIVVVAPAGNGSQDLDEGWLEGAFDRAQRDSGAILVGAGTPPSRDFPRTALDFSNHGTRVDVHAPGDEVTTPGYGDLFFPGGDVRQAYTAQFGGTSSAAALVAGAAALVQSIHLARSGAAIPPRELRRLLVETGTPSTGTRIIGPQPDVVAALDAAAWCGNARVDPGESCDDGNTVDDDGCTRMCESTAPPTTPGCTCHALSQPAWMAPLMLLFRARKKIWMANKTQ